MNWIRTNQRSAWIIGLTPLLPVILYGNSVAHCRRAAGLLAGEGFSRIYYLQADTTE